MPGQRAVPAFVGIVVLMLLLQLAGESARLALRFEREAILSGEIWRVLTAHVVHLSWAHCLLNLAGLVLCRLLCPDLFARPIWFWQLLALMCGTGLLLLLAAPDVPDYVGFSGVLYGLFFLGLWPQVRTGDRMALMALVILFGRMLWQWLAGASAHEEAMIGGRIIAEAHGFGVLVAVACLWVWPRLSTAGR